MINDTNILFCRGWIMLDSVANSRSLKLITLFLRYFLSSMRAFLIFSFTISISIVSSSACELRMSRLYIYFRVVVIYVYGSRKYINFPETNK